MMGGPAMLSHEAAHRFEACASLSPRPLAYGPAIWSCCQHLSRHPSRYISESLSGFETRCPTFKFSPDGGRRAGPALIRGLRRFRASIRVAGGSRPGPGPGRAPGSMVGGGSGVGEVGLNPQPQVAVADAPQASPDVLPLMCPSRGLCSVASGAEAWSRSGDAQRRRIRHPSP